MRLRETASATGGRRGSHATRWRPSAPLHNGTVAMFESHGFRRTRRIGKHHWVVAKVVR
jgi:hypothetical protein